MLSSGSFNQAAAQHAQQGQQAQHGLLGQLQEELQEQCGGAGCSGCGGCGGGLGKGAEPMDLGPVAAGEPLPQAAALAERLSCSTDNLKMEHS